MEGSEEDADDKPYEASARKLQKAREKGEVPHSADLTTAASYGGLLAACLAVGAWSVKETGSALAHMLSDAPRLAQMLLQGPSAATSGQMMTFIGIATAPLFLVPALFALLAVIAQGSLVIAPSKLAPKLERISPIAGAKRKFGRSGLFEFLKSGLKLCVFSAILAAYGLARLDVMLAAMASDAREVIVAMMRLTVEFLALVFAVLLVFGGLDMLFQRNEHARKQRMSRKELSDEQKESEGDPYMKGRRRDRAMQIATNRMLRDVPGADVVVVNPTHYAVALRWHRGSAQAPVCVAKGKDEIAHRIRAVAAEAGVPIHRDPPTARALHASLEIGQEISREHFKAVALAIRFADAMRAKAKGRDVGA